MIGDILTKLRKEKGYEAQFVANFLNVAKSTYSGYENNKSVPNHEILKKVADFYAISVDYILGRTNDPTPVGQPKEDREIIQELDEFIKKIQTTEGLMFSGGPMDDQTKLILLKMLENTKEMAQEMNKNKNN